MTTHAFYVLGLDRVSPTGSCHLPGSTRGDGFPPYDLVRLPADADGPERLRLTLAVAGYREGDLSVAVEDDRLIVRGAQGEEAAGEFLHRGIAARRFQRAFQLAPGVEVLRARLTDGLLALDLARPDAAPRRVPVAG